MEIFNGYKITNVDMNINILIISKYSLFYLSNFITRILYINDYNRYKVEKDFYFGREYFFCYGKIKNKIVKFIFSYIPLSHEFRGADLKWGIKRYLSRFDKYVHLIIYDSSYTFEEAKKFYNGIIDVYRELNIEDPISILVRYNYELDSNDKYVSDEEALEFTDKNNLYFAHIGCTEKYESGIKELMNTIFIKYIKKYKI